MKPIALVQARMGSTRLPGKVMMEINGKPVLWHVIDRLRRSKQLKGIVVATTTDPKDDVIEEFCGKEKIGCFRGSEEDVLDRYYQAATHFKADPVIRITSDCPLIDPEIVDRVIEKHAAAQADYASNCLVRCFPRGMDTEVFSYAALEKAHREATQAAEREHVTPYLYRRSEFFKLASVEADDACRRPDIRLCVDTQEDLSLIRIVYGELAGKFINCSDVVTLFEKKPDLLKINVSVKQKTL